MPSSPESVSSTTGDGSEEADRIDTTEPSNLYNAREQIENSEFTAPSGPSLADIEASATGAVATKKKKKARRAKKGGGKKKGGNNGKAVPVVAMEDDVLVMPGQEYAVVSFVDKREYTGLNEGKSREVHAAQNLIKIRGVFPSHERAQRRVKELMTVDPYFDLHIIKCGSWTLIGAGKGEDIEYENEGVNDIMGTFFEKHYTDVDKLRSRIAKAKAAGLPGLEAEAPSEFFEASKGVGDVSADVGGGEDVDELPESAERMTAEEAVAAYAN